MHYLAYFASKFNFEIFVVNFSVKFDFFKFTAKLQISRGNRKQSHYR